MKSKMNPLIMVIGIGVLLFIFVFLTARPGGIAQKNNVDAGKDFYQNKDTTHITGILEDIEVKNEQSALLTVVSEHKKIQILCTDKTYIGDGTKNPSKDISYLQKEVEAEINYFEENETKIAKTILILH